MPFNGSNVYSPPAADFPAVTNTLISSTHFNNVVNDIATALSDCVTRDGQGALTANLSAGGFKLTNIAAGVAGAPGLYFSSDASSGLYRPAADQIAISISGTQRFLVNSTGGTVTGSLSVTTSVVTPVIDSGSTGSLSLKTNNGTTQFRVDHTNTAVNFLRAGGAATGGRPFLGSTGSDTDVGLDISTQGAGIQRFWTNSFTDEQVRILPTAGSNRQITLTGSNGGNPTIGTTAGSLAITPSVAIAGTLLQVGTNPATLAEGIGLPSGNAVYYRNAANSGNVNGFGVGQLNGVNDITVVGIAPLNASDSNGTVLKGRSGAGVPGTNDIPAGGWAVWRDTSGGTTKLYYNNAGAIQSVALA